MGRRLIVIIVSAVAGVAVVAFGGLYLYITLSNRDAPAPVSLTPQTPLPSVAAGASASSASGGGASAAPVSSCDVAAPDGTWTVSTDGQSFVGYRVNEKLAALPTRSDAVGRTSAVTGSFTIAGTGVPKGDFTADLTKLTSNEGRRDSYITHNALQSSTFPTATFSLSTSLSIGSIPASGQSVSVTAHGSFTLHGTTKTVDIPLQAQRTCAGIEVVGSLPVLFSDYGMTAPNIGGIVSTDDHGTMELKLELVRQK